MTIYKDDIKLFESKVMTDESDGGGAMTDQEIISGEHNSIFPDISDLDRAYGVVGIRSIHLKVDADTDETYYGATVGLSETPIDENVDVTLMSVNDPYIEREETKELIEQYLTAGAKYDGELFYNHIKGQRSLKIMQRVSRSTPNAGDVLVVADLENDEEQYCRLTSVSSEVLDFEMVNYGEFDLRIITCEISEPLRFNFTGGTPNPYMPSLDTSRIYGIAVADASKYYGSKKLVANGEFATNTVKVDGIYNQLVPSARVDDAVVNEPIAEIVEAEVAINESGTETTTLPVVLESQSLLIDIDNQGYVYVQTLIPTPSKGTLIVKYMAQGNWYSLQEDGTGLLKGEDESHGAGTLDEFGNLTITTGGLPDIDSEIIMQWADVKTVSFVLPDTNVALNKMKVVESSSMVNRNLATFTWGEDKTATCVDGIISGDATGSVQGYSIHFEPNELPLPNTIISVSWGEDAGGVFVFENTEEDIVITENDTQYLMTVDKEIFGGSFYLPVTPIDYDNSNDLPNYRYEVMNIEILLDYDGNVSSQYSVNSSSTRVIGSYDKDTGVVHIEKSLLKYFVTHYEWKQKTSLFGGWTISKKTRTFAQVKPYVMIASYSGAVATETQVPIAAGIFDFSYDAIKFSIEQGGYDLKDETLAITLNNQKISVSEGIATVDGVSVGSLNDEEHSLLLNNWAVNDSGSDDFSVYSGLLFSPDTVYLREAVFVTAGSPVASRSFQVNGIDADGNHKLGIADENGIISGDGFTGFINNQLGIVKLYNANPFEALDIKYNCVYYNYLPLNADQLGLDPVRLPSDGRVVVFEKGDIVVIHQDNEETVTVEAGDTVQLEVRLATCTTTASDAVIDLDAGTVLFPTAGTFDIEYRFEDMALLTYVDISGSVKLSKSLSHNYDYSKSKMASVLIAGDLFARYTNLFDQKSWTGVFSDELIGEESPVSYNDTLYPVVVTNDGCITEQMAIVFTSSTSFKLIGSNIGQIAVGDVNTDFAPINPVSGKPYFTLNKLGWGSGWSTNNVLRFDTYGAVYQLNVIRTILQGDSTNTQESDQFSLQIRGNINKVVI